MNAEKNTIDSSTDGPSEFEKMEAYRQGLNDAKRLGDCAGYPKALEGCEILKEAYDCGWEDDTRRQYNKR